MKYFNAILIVLISCVNGISQTVIPLPGFQAVLNVFPTVTDDTLITAEFSITDFSNQFNGTDITDRENLVLWRNCNRYPVLNVDQAFATSVVLQLNKNGNPNLVPGVCALLQETPGMVSHLISGITDSDKQCIDSYYRVDALGQDSICCIDTLTYDGDSLRVFAGNGTFTVGIAGGSGGSTEYLEPYIVAGDTVGIIMKNVQDTVAFEGAVGSTGGGCDCATSVTLADHFVTTSSTALNTSLTYTFPEAGLYMIRFYGAYTSSLTTNGCRIKFNWTGAIQFGTGYWKGSIASNASVATELMRSIGSIGNDELVTSGVVPTSAAHNLEGQYLRNVPAGATLTIQFGAELSATSTTLIAGSTLIIQKL